MRRGATHARLVSGKVRRTTNVDGVDSLTTQGARERHLAASARRPRPPRSEACPGADGTNEPAPLSKLARRHARRVRANGVTQRVTVDLKGVDPLVSPTALTQPTRGEQPRRDNVGVSR